MYCSFYGIAEKPFSITPDPKYLFLGKTHKEAFAHLIYGIRERGGFIVITGDIGTGKTTLCRALLNHLDTNTLVAFIFNPTLSALELLKSINEDFGLRSDGSTQKELIDELNRFLLEKRKEGKNTVLIIDEAQNLRKEVLEHIRLLSNLETDTEKLIQIILIGQPEFREMLEQPELLQLNQRVTVRYHLNPLSRDETDSYIHHRLSVAGAEDKISFSPQAVRKISRCTKGVPRLINILCDRALLAGYTLRTREIDAGMIDRAYQEITGVPRWGKQGNFYYLFWRGWMPGVLLGVFVLVVGYGLNLLISQKDWSHFLVKLPSAGAPRHGATKPGRLDAAQTAAAKPNVSEVVNSPAPSPEADRALPAAASRDGARPENFVPQAPARDAAREHGISGMPPGTDALAFNTTDMTLVSEEKEPAGAGRLAEGVALPEQTAGKGGQEASGQEALRKIFVRSLASYSTDETLKHSFFAVSKKWSSRLADTGLPPNANLEDVIQAAARWGYSITPLQGNFNRVRALDIPAILDLNLGDSFGRRYVALLALKGTEAEIAPSLQDGSVHVPASLLEEFWYGNAYVLWKDMAGGQGVIASGTSGENVRWLQATLHSLNYLPLEPTGVFNEETAQALRKFQQTANLEEDGVVGPQTKICLLQALKLYEMPRLAPAATPEVVLP